jgi:hypothetical protein
MSISITKAELDSLIESAVKKALESSSAFFEEKLKEQQEQIVELQNSLKKAECANNKLEQYSRRSHIRIHGLKLQRGVNCKQAVCNFINDNLKNKNKQPLGVNPFDLDAAHPLPLHQKKEDPTTTLAKQQNDRPKPERLPVIIVRFHCRDLRDAVIKSRRQLKDTGISITEDLTTKNAALLYKLQHSEHFQSAWSWEGKIFARHKTSAPDSRPVKFDIFDA